MSETHLHIYVDRTATGLQEMSGRVTNILQLPKAGRSPCRVLLAIPAPLWAHCTYSLCLTAKSPAGPSVCRHVMA
jgi:hypothetical protein